MPAGIAQLFGYGWESSPGVASRKGRREGGELGVELRWRGDQGPLKAVEADFRVIRGLVSVADTFFPLSSCSERCHFG